MLPLWRQCDRLMNPDVQIDSVINQVNPLSDSGYASCRTDWLRCCYVVPVRRLVDRMHEGEEPVGVEEFCELTGPVGGAVTV